MNPIVKKAIELEINGDASGAMKILYPELDRLLKSSLWAEVEELFAFPLTLVPINISVAILIFTAKSKENLLSRAEYAKNVKEFYSLKDEFFYGL